MITPHIKNSVRHSRYFIIMTTLYAAIVSTLSIHFGATAGEIWMVFWHVAATFCSIIFILPIGNLLIACKECPKDISLFSKISLVLNRTEAMTITYFSTPRAADALVFLLCILPFFFSFIVAKSLIPFLHPYHFDPLFSRIDYGLHFEHYPHTLLPQLKHSFFFIQSAEFAYIAWFILLPIANGYAVFFDKIRARRNSYLWASFALWVIGGNILATVFSSVGPVFYGDFFNGPNPYPDILADVTTASSLGSVLWPETVKILLAFDKQHMACNLNAISAFPSMHVGASMLSTLYAYSISRKLGIFMALYTAFILMSSIILGMHYAIDGYFIILFIALVWWALNRFHSKITSEEAT